MPLYTMATHVKNLLSVLTVTGLIHLCLQTAQCTDQKRKLKRSKQCAKSNSNCGTSATFEEIVYEDSPLFLVAHTWVGTKSIFQTPMQPVLFRTSVPIIFGLYRKPHVKHPVSCLLAYQQVAVCHYNILFMIQKKCYPSGLLACKMYSNEWIGSNYIATFD